LFATGCTVAIDQHTWRVQGRVTDIATGAASGGHCQFQEVKLFYQLGVIPGQGFQGSIQKCEAGFCGVRVRRPVYGSEPVTLENCSPNQVKYVQ
jgi:hypothetical protein